MGKIYVGIDLGGSRLRLLAAEEKSGKIFHKEIERSPFLEEKETSFLDAMEDKIPLFQRASIYLKERILRFLQELKLSPKDVMGIGMSLAGKITPQKNFMGANTARRFAREESPGIWGIDVTSALKAHFPGVKVEVENDANATAQVAASYFESQGISGASVYFLTISTGIGGGSIHPIANEIGHILSLDGFPELIPSCGCGGKGCLEAYASGTGMAKRLTAWIALFQKDPAKFQEFEQYESLRWGRKLPLTKWLQSFLEKKKGENNITSKEIFARASEDLSCIESYLAEDGARRIAQACLGLSQLFDLQIICIGGGLVENNPWWLKRISFLLGEYLQGNHLHPRIPSVQAPPLGEECSDYGALCLVKKLDDSFWKGKD